MPVKPKPYKLVCPKCGYSRVVAPKSDVFTLKDLQDSKTTCPKCSEQMERKDVGKLNIIVDDLLNIFK